MIYGDNPDKDNPVPSMDAIMQSSNLYVYCGNNPVNRWDANGEEWIDKNENIRLDNWEISYKTFSAFKYAIGYKESTNNYKAVNRFGYLGRYQFGKIALQDIGF